MSAANVKLQTTSESHVQRGQRTCGHEPSNPRMKTPDVMPFNTQRMIFGGFEVIVEAGRK
jgi:uncharacterized protein YbaA (DUF1428 family)